MLPFVSVTMVETFVPLVAQIKITGKLNMTAINSLPILQKTSLWKNNDAWQCDQQPMMAKILHMANFSWPISTLSDHISSFHIC